VAVAKRLLDLVGAVLGLIVTAPLWVVIAVAIRLDSPGPVLFRQTRIGQHGRPFRIVKFRTMVVGADRQWTPPASQDELARYYFQDAGDPRITRVGRFLRRTSLDELPNLWNVLKGEMSLVGPRPEVPEIVALYTPEQRERLRMKPGITGLAQVSGRGTLSTAETLSYDLEYCRGWTLWTDLKILARTLGQVTRRHGAL
jgi:lipopolysaccharide/colanic/teichoic acid biosynthesis glycosyltransferase